jgi:ubiquinone/menaquinone biosynthesis C-methylase UbiE
MSDDARMTNASSTGQTGTESGFLDAHFEACRPQYEAILHSVGLQPGWRVLDAGCGGGGFLSLIADDIGPSGSIAAFDLAPDNVARVEALVSGWSNACPVEARVASLTALPYNDGEFDAVWCANAMEYLSDDEASTAISEFRRVVRAGGLVAIKDADPGLWLFSPGDPTLLWRMWEAASRISPPFRGCLHLTRTLRRRLERAGFIRVWQRATLCEIWAPLQPVERQYIGHQLMQMSALAERAGVPPADLEFWRCQRDPNSANSLSNHPNLFWCEGHFVAVGQVPDMRTQMARTVSSTVGQTSLSPAPGSGGADLCRPRP